MPLVVERAKIDGVKAALAAVQSNGQAEAALKAAKKAAADLARYLRAEGGSHRAQAARDLDAYADRLKPFEKQLAGAANAPVGGTWPKAKEQIFSLYMLAFTLEKALPPGVDFGDGWGTAISSAISDLPKTIAAATKVAAKAVQTIVTETAKVGGAVVWGFVAGAWPLLLVAGVVLVGYMAAKGKVAALAAKVTP
jgi:hypothetical protein